MPGVEPHEHQMETLDAPRLDPVLVEHDGRWWSADVLDQDRSRGDGHWRVVVRFTTEPGSTYVLAMPAEQCRATRAAG